MYWRKPGGKKNYLLREDISAPFCAASGDAVFEENGNFFYHQAVHSHFILSQITASLNHEYTAYQ